MSYDNAPLPDGWVREFDPTLKHPFWVDTTAQPPRSIWVHPYEDEQFLREHPDVRDRLAQDGPSGAPPPYSPRRHSYGGSPSDSHLGVPHRSDALRTSHSQPGTPNPGQPHRGFFGKLKDKAIGTKEEREARRQEEKRREELYMQQMAEQRRLRQEAFQQREVDDSADLASEVEALADLALEVVALEVEALLFRYWQEQLEAFFSETYSMDLTMVEGTGAEDLMAEDLMVEDLMEALTEPPIRKTLLGHACL
ncbi:hypothetical protein C8Q74DRAFT_1364538 [Fomes fomentarius]|nr:hypothetical protein C8Q74DRAFT_1364538 [Fomes fomentarius]